MPLQYGTVSPTGSGANPAEATYSQKAVPPQTANRSQAKDENSGGRFTPAFSFPTDSFWLQINGITNGMASLTLNHATGQVYEVLSKTDLVLTNWTIEPGEVWPTNSTVMPFTVSLLDRTNALFIRAADWTGVTENGNAVPDWWFWKYFGTVALSDTNLDTAGHTLLYDYQNGLDPSNPGDYYNGRLPELELVSGNNQTGSFGSFLPLPLTVRVTDSNSNTLANAPVTLSVSDYAQLTKTTDDVLASSLMLRTDANGLASARVYIPTGSVWKNIEIFVWVSAQSGSNTVQTNFTGFVVLAGGVTPMLAVGGERIMELLPTGDLVSWGGNQYGELGDYTCLDSTNSVHVVGLTNLIKIVSGLNHALALDSHGIAWAWGENDSGELGDGGLEGFTSFPQPVPGMTNTIAIAAHGYIVNGDPGLALAVGTDGTVWAWGTGNGYWVGPSPVQIMGASNMINVAAGAGHALALKNDGTVWAWGADNHGQLGDGGTLGYSDTPVQVSGLSNIVAICAGDDFSLALDVNGCVWAWGFNYEGQLGDGGTELDSDVPVMVAGLTNMVAVAAGASFSLALDQAGKLWAWGSDNAGQLGDGGSAGTHLPIQIPELSNIVTVAAGSDAAVALDGNGNVWQWGSSDSDGANWAWGDENGYPRLAPNYADFFDGQLPHLTILSGNNQAPHAGMEFPQPLVIQATDINGAVLSNAPVSVEVISGDMALRTVRGGSDYNALRLTTDANGAVTLIGYADRYVNDPNCLVRVLAASRERIAEADFHETLIPVPTINITSPVNCGSELIGPNEPLAITVDAEPAPGASIREVDYSYQTDGGDNIPLGVSTQSPYSFNWTNSSWWADAFAGQYTLSAVAVDNAGVQSDPQSVSFMIALDSDGGGLPDYWQLQYFGHLGMDPDSDLNGNGQSLLYDYQNGMDPTDYYDGVLPNLTILSGNDQDGTYGSFLPLPVIIEVTKTYSTLLTNAPVTLTVTNGTALLAASKNDAPTVSLELRTDTNGQVLAWIYFPPAGSNVPDSTIVARACSGNNSVTDVINEFIPLAHWRFDDTNTWVGEAGQLPLLATNVIGVPSWCSNAVRVDSVYQARLAYDVVETNGHTNINCQTGSLLFWFQPGWSSTNAGGNGPGHWGRLIEMGDNDPDLASDAWITGSTNGWWALYLNPDGTQLSFGTSTNGGGTTNVSANISWFSNEWYQIALTYSPAGSALYVNGQLLASGAGVTGHPDANELSNGFRIGSDLSGFNQAEGAFDELQTFDYPLDAANTATYESQIPDWWELQYFGRTGLDPRFQPAGDGFTLLFEYQRRWDPNVISFSLSATNRYVNTNTAPVQINVFSGEPVFMAIMVDHTNPPDAKYQPFGTTLNLGAAAWQPYNPDIIASLNSGDGDYNVWVGVKGRAPDAQPAWQWLPLIMDTVPPVLAVTNPVASRVARPMIQLQGYANESLGSLTYDISNAAGVWTNQEGYITGQQCDTNLRAITTNWFQCYDIVLATNGPNVLSLHAADLAGNPFNTNLSFTVDCSLDTNPPVFVLSWPQDGMAISGASFTLQGSVSDPMATVAISIADGDGNTNIVSGTITRDGEVWADNVPLGNGTNKATVTTTDAAGNSAVNFSVFKNDVGLTLNPLTSDQLNQSHATISGSIGNSGDTIIVNGQAAAIRGDGTWTADVPVNSSGQAIFDAAVYDSGNHLIASQSFNQTQPASVGLKSFWRKTSSHYFDWGWPGDGWVGFYNTPQGIAGPVFENMANEVEWTYQSGGIDAGYYFHTGAISSLIWLGEEPRLDYTWAQVLAPGEDLILSWYSSSFGGAQWESASDTQAKVAINPSDPAVAGQTATYLVQAQAWSLNSMGGYGRSVPPDSVRICGQLLTPVTEADGSVWGQTVIRAPAGAKVDVTPVARGNFHFDVQAVELGLQIAVDNNRDGNITFDGADQTSVANPYRFWINDSQEHDDDETSEGAADDQIPGSSSPNYEMSRINGDSDFVNFFPVVLNLSNALQLLPPSAGFEYHLVQNDDAVKFVYTDLTLADPFNYQTNSAGMYGFGSDSNYWSFGAPTIQITTAPGVTLNTNWLMQILNNGGNGIVLIEGCAATTKPLWLEIWRNGKLLGGTPLYLSISGVEQMFRHANFCYVNGIVTVPARTDAPNEPPNNGKNLVFLTGYNVNQQQARGVESEMFKRFYWSGSKARFYGVTWNGAESQVTMFGFTPNYHTNVVNALDTASLFANFINNLSGGTVIAAHSLGNMIVLSAISDYHIAPSKYFMIDAAVPMEAIQGSTPNESAMIYSTWQIYSNRLYASDWWQLFTNGDARSSLTWSNRLGNLSSVDIYNFYSSGEEVLRTYPQNPNLTIITTSALELYYHALGIPFGTYAWVWQEKGKGTYSTDGFVGSSHGGWLFNSLYDGSFGHMVPGDAANLPASQLQTNAFFCLHSSLFSIGAPNDLPLEGTDGASYAQANRDRILSDAIPALTLPVGANAVSTLDDRAGGKRNFDMRQAFKTGWPGSRVSVEDQQWHHSDFDYVAYPFIHQLFDSIVNTGNLK